MTSPPCSQKTFKLKHEYATAKFAVESTYNLADLTTTATTSVEKINLGASATLNIASKELKSYAFAATLTEANTVFAGSLYVCGHIVLYFHIYVSRRVPPSLSHARSTDCTSVAASIYNAPNADTQIGGEVAFKLHSKENTVRMPCATDTPAHPCSSTLWASSTWTRTLSSRYVLCAAASPSPHLAQLSLNNTLQFGVAFTSKLASNLSVTLAGQVAANNLASDSHRLGAAITFEN